MKKEKTDKMLIIRVTESENKILEKRLKISKMKSMSAFLRQQIVNGIYLEYDHEELQKIQRAVMSIANNINQIAHRVNSTGRVYEQDLKEIQEEMREIWLLLLSIQTELQRLNLSNISQIPTK